MKMKSIPSRWLIEEQLPTGTPWLSPSADAKDGHTVDIRKPFRRVVAAAGMDPDEVVRHTLRHTSITHLIQAGVDLTHREKNLRA
jgi:site-specific recombinase XerD